MTKVWGIHMPEWFGDDPIDRGATSAWAGGDWATSLQLSDARSLALLIRGSS